MAAGSSFLLSRWLLLSFSSDWSASINDRYCHHQRQFDNGIDGQSFLLLISAFPLSSSSSSSSEPPTIPFLFSKCFNWSTGWNKTNDNLIIDYDRWLIMDGGWNGHLLIVILILKWLLLIDTSQTKLQSSLFVSNAPLPVHSSSSYSSANSIMASLSMGKISTSQNGIFFLWPNMGGGWFSIQKVI